MKHFLHFFGCLGRRLGAASLAAAAVLPLALTAQPGPSHESAAQVSPNRCRAATGAGTPVPSLAAPGHAVLRPGVQVFAWLPDPGEAAPGGYNYKAYDFGLLSYVACPGYRLGGAGALLPPPAGPPDSVAAWAHRTNPSCRVLLEVSYHAPRGGEPASGVAGAAQQPALAQAIAQQVAAAHADGVSLDFAFGPARPQAAAGALSTSRPGSQAELARAFARLNNTRIRLNARKKALARAQAAGPLNPHTKALNEEIATYRRAWAAYKQGRVMLPVASPDASSQPAAFRRFVAVLARALRHQNPGASTIAISLPAVDSASVFSQLAPLDSLVQAFVIKAFDYTAGRPGPLSPLRPSSRWGPAAISTSVAYYQQQGVPRAKLLVGFPQVGKAAATVARPLGSQQYLPNRVWRAYAPAAQQLDTASGGVLLRFASGAGSASAEVWAEDSVSLAGKYAWVVAQGLGGVGVWALGFEAPGAPTWSLLRARFAAAPRVRGIALPQPLAGAAVPRSGAKVPALVLALSPLGRGLLFVVLVLVGSGWVGLVIGLLAHARFFVPFAQRLVWVLLLVLGTGIGLLLLLSLLAIARPQVLLASGLIAVGLLGLGLLAHYGLRPRELP